MVSMLEALDVRDGHKILELGTGTGYNAALLSARLRDRGLFSIDIAPHLVDTARERLTIGHLARLEVRSDDTAQARFWPTDPGGFMSARTDVGILDMYFGLLARDLREAVRRSSKVDGAVLIDEGFRFALWAHAPQMTIAAGLEPVGWSVGSRSLWIR